MAVVIRQAIRQRFAIEAFINTPAWVYHSDRLLSACSFRPTSAPTAQISSLTDHLKLRNGIQPLLQLRYTGSFSAEIAKNDQKKTLSQERTEKPNLSTLETWEVDRLSKQGSFDTTDDLHEQLRSKTSSPTAQTFITDMKLYMRQRKTKKLSQVFNEYLESKAELDVDVFNTYLFGISDTGDISAAVDVVEMMEERYGISRDSSTFQALMIISGKAGDRDKIREYFDQANEISPKDIRNYKALFNAFADATDFEIGASDVAEGKRYLERLKSDGMELSSLVYTMMIRLCSRAGMLEEAMKYLEESKQHCQPLQSMYNPIMECISMKEFSDYELKKRMTSLMHNMLQHKLRPTVITVTNVIRVFEQSGDATKAYACFVNVLETATEGKGFIISAIVICLEKLTEAGFMTPEEAYLLISDVIAETVEVGIRLNFNARKAWLNVCCLKGDYDTVVKCWKHLSNQQSRVDSSMIKWMINLHLKQDRIDAAMEMFSYMDLREIKPKPEHFLPVFEYLKENKCKETAADLYARMVTAKIQPTDALNTCLKSLHII